MGSVKKLDDVLQETDTKLQKSAKYDERRELFKVAQDPIEEYNRKLQKTIKTLWLESQLWHSKMISSNLKDFSAIKAGFHEYTLFSLERIITVISFRLNLSPLSNYSIVGHFFLSFYYLSVV